MNTPEPELPKHLYIESSDPHGPATRLTLAPDKLIAWSESGRGDAIDQWCREICDRKIAAINTWKDNRILQLEDDWASTENHIEDEDDDEAEERYHQACELVVLEAERKRKAARERMAEQKATIEQLVQRAKAFSAAHTPPPQESHMAGYLVAIAALAAVAYVLLT